MISANNKIYDKYILQDIALLFTGMSVLSQEYQINYLQLEIPSKEVP